MFGSFGRLEAQVQTQGQQLAATATALNGHLNDCSRRYDQTKDALDKLDNAIEKSAAQRRADIEKLENRVDQRHRENKKLLWLLLAAAIPVFADKVVNWIASIQHVASVH